MALNDVVAGSGISVTRTGKTATITATGGGGAHASSHQPGGNDAMAVDAAAGTGSLRTVGTGAQQACAGNDGRLSDARTPLGHGHAQADVTNLVSDLAGKAASSHTHPAADIASGTIATARLGSGTADATKYLRGDQTWATPAGGGAAREDLVAQWDVSATKTNIGASFVDVYIQTNAEGKSAQIDTNGKTQVKLYVLWNKIGSGTQTIQVLEVGTANVLITLNVVSGRNVSALTNIPAGLANAVKNYKLQAKSTTAADDPIFEGARVYLK